VELTKDDGGGDVAEMQLVLPESYTLTMPKEPFPWSGYPKPLPVAGPLKAPGQLEIE
jgi:hypothetical protein